MITRLRIAIAATALAGALSSTAAQGSDVGQQAYQRERAHCLSGASQQDRATCLKEANAALQTSRRDGLATPAQAQRDSNTTQRCRAQQGTDQAACLERLESGTTEGSVNGGGIIRRTESKAP